MLNGRVTDVLGKPIVKARVYVMPRGGGRIQSETDKDGRYELDLGTGSGVGGAYSVVIAVGHVHTYRQVLVSEHAITHLDVEVETDIDGGEVIKIVDARLPPPAVLPKPANEHSRKSLPYSPQAMERDAWARAFLLLDINDKGQVTRLKLLKRPGFDLDQIAIDEAFKLQFEPARDAAGRPVRTYIIWDMEWPSWGWLVGGGGTAAGRPVADDSMYRYNRSVSGGTPSSIANANHPGQVTNADSATGVASGAGDPGDRRGAATVNLQGHERLGLPLPISGPQPLSRVPCAGSGPLNLDLQNRAYRDCSRPDLTNVDALPWITRENAKTALAALDSNKPQVVPGPRRSRVPALISTGVTGVFTAGLVYSFVKYNALSDRTALTFQPNGPREGHLEGAKELRFWGRTLLGFAGACVVSGAVTAFLWGRSQTHESFSVQPSKGGGTVSYGRSF